MQVTKRLVNRKTHTIGYLVGGQWRTRREAVRLAKKGKIKNVIVRRCDNGEYIASRPDFPRLGDLPAAHKDQVRNKKARRTGVA